MAFGKPIKTRRREVRKVLRDRRSKLTSTLSRRQALFGVGLGVLFWLAATAIVWQARQQPVYQTGQIVDRAIVTRVDLQWEDEDQTKTLREIARRRAPSVYTPNPLFFQGCQKLNSLPAVASTATSVDQIAPEIQSLYKLSDVSIEQLKKYQQDGKPTAEWTRLVDDLVSKLQWVVILRQERYQKEIAAEEDSPSVVLKLPGDQFSRLPKTATFNLAGSDQNSLKDKLASLVEPFPRGIRESVAQYLMQLGEPSYVFDQTATQAAQDLAAARVSPIFRNFKAGEVIVPAGARLDGPQYVRLRLERDKFLDQLPPLMRWLTMLGPAVVVMLVTAGLVVSVLVLRPRVAENPMRGLALTLLLLSTAALAWLLQPSGPYMTVAAAVTGVMLVAVILVVAYDQALAIAVSTLQAVLVAVMLQLSVGLLLVTIAAAVISILQLRQVRKRGTLIRMGVVTGLIVAAGVFAAQLADRDMVFDALSAQTGAWAWEAGAGLTASVVIGFFVLGVLPFIEKMFKVTTAMTLLELSDVNQPLLRKLAQAAPGTYNHSLTVALIAEAAAESIGANGLLCRIGAYYHDIGKIHKPQYFIENQGGGPNRHDKLSPAMSLLIIVGHVKDGMELAREYGLPSVLHHFIESHHGTTLVEYFYHAAKQLKGEDQAQPSEFEYRYPGPKPQTREAAILMICDSVESATRAMTDPTAGRIEQLVNKMAMKRLMDGQFDDCDLTLEELHDIEESITKSLAGVYHGRIKYPTNKPAPGSSDNPTDTVSAAG
ncbi:MAG: HD family phosphohydrolase [Phycisphaerales bacterium]